MKRRTTRLRRAWNIWLVLPEPARLGLLIVALVLLARLVGWLTP